MNCHGINVRFSVVQVGPRPMDDYQLRMGP